MDSMALCSDSLETSFAHSGGVRLRFLIVSLIRETDVGDNSI